MDKHKRIIFFDGFCILCNGFVDFVFRRDKKHVYYFASLQGKTAQQYLDPQCIDALKSIVYVAGDECKQRSDAVIAIVVGLGGLYTLAHVLRIIPRPFRDFIYDWIGKNRYKWFGKRDACRVPSPEDKGRMLE